MSSAVTHWSVDLESAEFMLLIKREVESKRKRIFVKDSVEGNEMSICAKEPLETKGVIQL